MIAFGIGFLIGGTFGVALTAIAASSSDRKERKNVSGKED